MNWKNVTVILCSVLMLVAIGLGVSIIYSDYLYSPTGTLDSLLVMGSEYVTATASAADTQLLKAIEAWAKEERATVLFKNNSENVYAGCGFCGYSDWAKQELGIDAPRDMGDGVYVVNDPAVQRAYVNEGILLPKLAGLEIRGTYRTSPMPSVLRGVDFLYPLSIATSAVGMYFTDAEDTSGFEALIDASGYSVVSTRRANQMTLGQLMTRLVSDSLLSRAVLAAMTGLIACFIYSVLMLYKDNARRLWVHHMFGLSRKRILLKVLLLTAGMDLAAVLIFGAVLLNGLTYLESADLRRVFSGALTLYILLTVFVNGLGYCRTVRQFKLRGA